MAVNGSTAVVVGRSMAGLSAAAALSRHFSDVIVIDRDPDNDTDQPRPGVGQAYHYHALLQGGMQALDRLLPGVVGDLRSSGAVEVPFALGVHVFDAGDWQPNRDLGFIGLNATRGLIERATSARVRHIPGVRIWGSCKLARLLFDNGDHDEDRVCGVEIRRAHGPVETVAADLVVDCTGRVSKVPEVLLRRGFDPIQQFTLNIGISYTSALFHAPLDAAEGFAVVAITPEPPAKRGGFVARLHDETWIVSLHTRFEQPLPKNYDEMLAFAETFEVADVAAFLRQASLLGEVRTFRKTQAVWRRFDRAERFPEGLLISGDAIASFNPIFGQGMSVAALQACALDDVLTERLSNGSGLGGIAKDYFPLAAMISGAAWGSSTAVDSAYEEVTGDRNPKAAQNIKVMRGLRRLIIDDPKLHADVFAVGGLMKPGAQVMTPEVIARAIAAAEDP